jgi:hypothetical protein
MFKMAGANAALVDLGLLPPEELEKTAIVSAIAKAAPKVWGGLKWVGSKLWGKGGKGGALGAVAEPIGRAGQWAAQRGGTAMGLKPGTISKVQDLGKGMAREAVGFGALSGGLSAATAEPGQRGEAFLRGFGSGALGGLAWRGAGNLATAGLKRGLGAGAGGAARVERMTARQGQPWLGGGKMGVGERAKVWGSKALMGGVPFAAGMGASMMMPTFEGGHGAPRTQAQRFAPYAARLGGGTMMGAYPSHPMGYAYNPNLPMPQ